MVTDHVPIGVVPGTARTAQHQLLASRHHQDGRESDHDRRREERVIHQGGHADHDRADQRYKRHSITTMVEGHLPEDPSCSLFTMVLLRSLRPWKMTEP